MRKWMVLVVALIGFGGPAAAQIRALKIDITDGVIEKIPFAAPSFVAENSAASEWATKITALLVKDLNSTGLFREVQKAAYISQITSFASPVQFSDWKAINVQALLTGAVKVSPNGQLVVKFRSYDVFAGKELGAGLQFVGTKDRWRRIAHKVADTLYSRLTGEMGYFDSQVVFVSETGPKNARKKALAIMDSDGANLRALTNDKSLVLAPRFSPDGKQVLYTSYESGFPRIYLLTLRTKRRQVLENQRGTMSFAPRFASDGDTVVYSMIKNGNTDIYRLVLSSGQSQRLTTAPSIETAPSVAPDGAQIVFESDRSGKQQLYIMSVKGGEARRISFGQGRYGTPVWSPRGDMIAFTKQSKGRFHIGVMRADGSEERLLTASFLDEGPTWAPNGRVIMFTRETRGSQGASELYSIDVSGRNLRPLQTPNGASDPSWSPLGK